MNFVAIVACRLVPLYMNRVHDVSAIVRNRTRMNRKVPDTIFRSCCRYNNLIA